MTENEFKRLDIEKQVQIANKRCAELNGKKLTEKFRCENLQIDYQTVAKILNKHNYTLFRGRFYKVQIEEKNEPVRVDVKAELFDLIKASMGMKDPKSAYFKITDELLEEWNEFRDKKFDYVPSSNLIVMAMIDFMKKYK